MESGVVWTWLFVAVLTVTCQVGSSQNSAEPIVIDPSTTTPKQLAQSGIPAGDGNSASTSSTPARVQSGIPDAVSTSTTQVPGQPIPPVIQGNADSTSTTTSRALVTSGNMVIADISTTSRAWVASGNPVIADTSTTSRAWVASGNPVNEAGSSTTKQQPVPAGSDIPQAASSTTKSPPVSGNAGPVAASTTQRQLPATNVPGNAAVSTTVKSGTNLPQDGAASTTLKPAALGTNIPDNGASTTSRAPAGGTVNLYQSTTRQVINTVRDLPSTTRPPVVIKTNADVPVPTPTVNTIKYVFTGILTTLPTTPVHPGLDIYHCQLMLSNDFELTLNASGLSADWYAAKLAPVIAGMVGVDAARITDVSVHKHPDTGAIVLKFDVRPPLSSCKSDCFVSSRFAVDTINNMTIAMTFNMTDKSLPIPQKLFANPPPSFYAWTDKGPCPVLSCDDKSACDCQLTGVFYCKCLDVNDCPSSVPVIKSSKSNQKLWALIVIPIVLIIVLIIVLVVLIRLRLIKIPKRKLGPTVRNYKPAYDIGTIVDNPMMATLDPGAANRLYKTMSSNLGYAFHDKAFQDNGSDSSSGVDSSVSAPFGGP